MRSRAEAHTYVDRSADQETLPLTEDLLLKVGRFTFPLFKSGRQHTGTLPHTGRGHASAAAALSLDRQMTMHAMRALADAELVLS